MNPAKSRTGIMAGRNALWSVTLPGGEPSTARPGARPESPGAGIRSSNDAAPALSSLPPAAVVVAAAAEEEEQQEDNDDQCGGTHGGGQPITASHRRLPDSHNRHRLGFKTLRKNVMALTDEET